MSNQPLLSDLEVREQSLAQVCDALAALQQVPAAGLNEAKHEMVTGMVDDARSLERSLSNEIDQMRGDSDE
ncbi:hypothetical protein [Natronorubrum aibiense]|uniref:Uncharacterized protein n=1 Tax=Natronorubrum aibiense TaxID=348826 RepID=A0A5P9P1M3_9EURY|nr:hypothetical protein [Natronorubrum aibiense]QFU81750.1 hypothetical protein GCU68_03870 [Natronorubrum aibiense]